jgi:hypothetical protein
MPKRMLQGRLYSKRRKGRLRMRWLDDVEGDLKKMKVKGWKEKMRKREQWRLVVEEAKAHPGLWRRVEGRKEVIQYSDKLRTRQQRIRGLILVRVRNLYLLHNFQFVSGAYSSPNRMGLGKYFSRGLSGRRKKMTSLLCLVHSMELYFLSSIRLQGAVIN